MYRYLIIVLSVAAMLLGGCATTKSVVDRPELFKLTENRAATYRVEVLPVGHGSGVVITRSGYILTCAHVADAGLVLRIAVRDGGTKPIKLMADVVAVDKTDDLALLKVDHRFAAPAVLSDMSELHPGDAIYNVGYPFSFGEMIGRGYIMRLHYSNKDLPVNDNILVDISDGPGASGSGLFLERNGRLVGLLRMTVTATSRGQPPTVVHAIVSVAHIRAFLEVHRIAYLTPKGPRTYPPPPVRALHASPHAAHPAPKTARAHAH